MRPKIRNQTVEDRARVLWNVLASGVGTAFERQSLVDPFCYKCSCSREMHCELIHTLRSFDRLSASTACVIQLLVVFLT